MDLLNGNDPNDLTIESQRNTETGAGLWHLYAISLAVSLDLS